MALLYERCDIPTLAPVLFNHDEIVIECGEEDASTAKDFLVSCMVDGMNAVLNKEEPHVPIEVEAEITDSWAK